MSDDFLTFQKGGKAPGQRVEAVAHMHRYTANGYWRLEVVGLADTEAEAAAAAKLLLGQASAAVRIAVSVPNRVPETQESGKQG